MNNGDFEHPSIQIFSRKAAKAIAERKIFDVDDVSGLLARYMHEAMLGTINEYINGLEDKYYDLVQKQKKRGQGNPDYFIIGQELRVLKLKMKNANKAANNLKRQEKFSRLKAWVIDKFGSEVLREFYDTIDDLK